MRSYERKNNNTLIFRLVKYASVIITLTGLVYFWMKYVLTSNDAFSVVNHPWQSWVLKLHVLAAPVFVFVFGSLFFTHVLPMIKSPQKRARRSGMISLVSTLILIASGYVIQSFSEVNWKDYVAWIHIGFGGLFTLVVGVHAFYLPIRRKKKSQHAISFFKKKALAS